MRGYCSSAHICGPVRTRPGGKVEKIVVAGIWDYTGSVYLYDIATNKWEAGGCSLKVENDRKGHWPVGWALSAEIFRLFRLLPRHFGFSFGRSLNCTPGMYISYFNRF